MRRASPDMTLPSIKKVEIQITTACNMACRFCFAKAGRNAALPVELANKAMIQFAEQRNGKMDGASLWLTGGEALLTDACRPLVAMAARLGLKTGVATNGLLLGQKADSLKAAGLEEVRVSLDSVNSGLFDQMRGTHKALTQVLRSIETATRVGLKTGVRFTAIKNNGNDLEPVVRQARELGVSYVEVKAVLPIGRGSSDVMLPPQRLNKLMKEAVGLSMPALPVHVLCSYLPPCKGFDVGPNHVPCVCATEAMYVAVNGDLMPCSYFPPTFPFNIRRHSLRKAWTSKAFEEARNGRPDKCQLCETWGTCRNGCPALLAHYSNIKASCFGLAENLRRKGSHENVCING